MKCLKHLSVKVLIFCLLLKQGFRVLFYDGSNFGSSFLPPLFFLLTGGGDSSDNTSSDDSLLDRVNSFGQTENATSGQTENQYWEELSQINSNSDNARFGLEINFNVNNGSPNPENEYVPSTRLPRGDNMENIQRQVENSQSESFIRPSTPEQSTTKALIGVPVTRGQ